jgi:hypothetical protein
MTDLIERLERATGPDPQLDVDIFFEAVWTGQGDERTAPAYTESMDAALTLLGDRDWEAKTAPHRKGGIARVVEMERTIWAEAASPAIALCIAALKARIP